MLVKLLVLYSRVSPMAWLDRARGNPVNPLPKPLALLGMGHLCALLVGHGFDWHAPLIMLAIWGGHSIGYGHPLGYALSGLPRGDYEEWQLGPLKTSPFISLCIRGVFVGVATIIAYDLVATIKIALAFGIAFPLASYIVRFKLRMATSTASTLATAWAVQEKIRGALIELVLLGALWLTLILEKLYL